MSGTTSQPNLNSLVAALAHTDRDSQLNFEKLNRYSEYWETVRTYYLPFDNAPKSGSADVYVHEMPGGQYTNLKEQAEGIGLGGRWPEVARTYAEVNMAFGDIVKVTPSSKVVGDLALFLLSHGMTVKDLENLPPDHQLTIPNSVVDMFMGSLGEPDGGWPLKLRQIVLRGKEPLHGRPGEQIKPVNLSKEAEALTAQTGATSRTDLMSYLMYPDVFLKFSAARSEYGDLDVLPTPPFLYGLKEGGEICVDLEPGKTLIIRLLTVGEPRSDGMRPVFFELNGQRREVEIRDKSVKQTTATARKADPGQPGQIAAPIPGAITSLQVKSGQHVNKGDRLLVMEAMKMQTTVYAPISGTVREIIVNVRDSVEARDLLVMIEPNR
jgi:pyruvate carboxylase